MSNNEEYDESANMEDDSGIPNPGAPTPLSALEVCMPSIGDSGLARS